MSTEINKTIDEVFINIPKFPVLLKGDSFSSLAYVDHLCRSTIHKEIITILKEIKKPPLSEKNVKGATTQISDHKNSDHKNRSNLKNIICLRGCSYGGELARLAGLARLSEILPSLRNSYKNLMCLYEK